MTSKAASLVQSAKQWAGNYGDYPNGPEGAALTAVLRARVAWTDNDPDAFAAMFVENGSLLIGDEQQVSREEIRAHLAKGFAGALKGTRLAEEPKLIQLLRDDVALVVMEGGVVRPGATSVAPDDETRAVWVVVKRDGDWRVLSYQSCPVRG